MKIEGPGALKGGAPTKRRTTASGGTGGFDRMLVEGEAPAGAAGPSGPAPVPLIDPLLALQEVADEEQKRRAATERGNRLLERLERLRDGLIIGQIEPGELRRLADLVAAERSLVADPMLAALLDEIELRAHVELAKRGLTV